MTNKIGSINVGTSSTLKFDAEDASAKAAAAVAAATQEMENAQLAEGQIMFKTVGDPVFNCFSNEGKTINFTGGAFIAEKDDKDVMDTLEYHESKGHIVRAIVAVDPIGPIGE